ncbi:MAG: hypothetical protein AB9903_22840 [Vulcanimicrobiota bacterium]
MSEQIDGYKPGGVVHDAYDYWNQLDKSKDTSMQGDWKSKCSGGIVKGGSKLMKGLISISGLREVEDSSGKLGYDVGRGAPRETILKDSGKALFDTGMAAVTFIPAGKVLAGLSKGKKLYTTAKGGTAITSMALNAGKSASKPVAQELTAAISKTIPEGGKVTAEHSKALLGELTEIGKKYRINIKEGGMLGQSTGSIDNIAVNTKVGGPHEIGHVVQQLQTRATALEAQAQKLGKPVNQLSQAERKDAFEKFVKPFEEAAYNQHEMYALDATTRTGAARSTYGESLKKGVAHFEEALSSGKVPVAEVSTTANVLGRTPNVLGRSIGESGLHAGYIGAGSVNYTRDELTDHNHNK